jgi:hypothetical protein
MAKRIKYTEKELKGPDKFVSTVVSGFEYFSDHSKKILIGVVVIVALIIVGYIVAGMAGKKSDIAGQKFSDAVAKYNIGSSEEALSEFASISEYSGRRPRRLLLRAYTV